MTKSNYSVSLMGLLFAVLFSDFQMLVNGFTSVPTEPTFFATDSRSSPQHKHRRGAMMNLPRRNNGYSKINRFSTSCPPTTSSLALPMFMESTDLSGVSGFASVILSHADPLVEAEVLNDLAHVSLDLVTLLGPATLAIRSAAVLGRLFAMAADYVPDHTVLPTELVFQTFMLVISVVSCIKAATPLALASLCSDISLRDGKAYCSIFREAGMTWSQYRALMVYSLDWIHVEAGTVIDSAEQQQQDRDGKMNHASRGGDYMYWLYSGQVSVTSHNRELYTVSRNQARGQEPSVQGLWGESSLFDIKAVTSNESADSTSTASSNGRNKSNTKNKSNNDYNNFPRTTLKATGTRGATLLRLRKSKLIQLMDMDPALAESMRNLVFQGMQAKLAAQLKA